ncbi:hypothetical protein F0562_017133 [Nyssa sinensis]|uniref:Uncharacterized protein n=1 Tax=Nyssa sinensis TaxID=561372 RepID=A0A5J4ZGC1_9ASTE|nr:hypothetical protein F0562_017133 [Nyssa sinensis]
MANPKGILRTVILQHSADYGHYCILTDFVSACLSHSQTFLHETFSGGSPSTFLATLRSNLQWVQLVLFSGPRVEHKHFQALLAAVFNAGVLNFLGFDCLFRKP